jgi:cytochrome c
MISFSYKILIALFLLALVVACNRKEYPPRILVFTKTKGWRHSSIPAGLNALRKLGAENGFDVDTTENGDLFSESNLKKYQAVVFLNTTGNVLSSKQQTSFERYIQAGGGFVGIHSAADTEYEWPWYSKLMGAHFLNHPLNPGIRRATVKISQPDHPATKGLPAEWERDDEWYNYRSFYAGLNFLAFLDETSYEGGTHGNHHPIAWYHEFDGGRAFYTGGGHTEESYTETKFLQHVLGGIQYALGTGELDFSKSHSEEVPEENRFVKSILANDLDIPMELCVSKDGRIFYSELKGRLLMYDTRNGDSSLVHKFQVETRGGTGLLGVTLDPGFLDNRFIYVYYSPPAEREPYLFNLSRFTLTRENKLEATSEKILLQVPVQEKSGAHHGGSFAWDKDGNLYLSTGDSSSPFPANGYAPLDERPGAEYYSLDAQRSSSNTNDFKGKVLRIHPESDGTYSIPQGNLFPKGKPKTKPEIFAMGCRNPYRIAVNPETSVLYWGDIGPDAGKDSIQGPKGYDEFNQARQAGNFGWPYFVGDNQAYSKWNFASSIPGPKFDPENPVNNSPNNTGLEKLPPALPAMIWYPYSTSEKFPELGEGGRSAMAGDFYLYDKASLSPIKFPQYYNGCLFVFDWMRNWVIALRFDKDENFLRSEPFMVTSGDFRRPIDLTFGPDGVMYMLEYGSVYGADNDDARLVKIEYNSGNRAPIAKASLVDSAAFAKHQQKVFLTSELRNIKSPREISGPVPLKVKCISKGSSDPDDDDTLSLEWLINGNATGVTNREMTHTFSTPGTYTVILKVSDNHGETDRDTLIVVAGNEKPVVAIVTSHNKSFFWGRDNITYNVKVSDNEDETISKKDVKIYYEYFPFPPGREPLGLSVINNSDCKACHMMEQKSVGPSYLQIAERYKNATGAIKTLSEKIIQGGGGNWGEHVMSAHPQISSAESQEIVKYILSLGKKMSGRTYLPVQGSISLTDHHNEEELGAYIIQASYSDKGSNGVTSLSNNETFQLRNARIPAVYADDYKGFQRFRNTLTAGGHKSHYYFKDIDLTSIENFMVEYSSEKLAGEIEVRIDSYAGPVIAKFPFDPTGNWDTYRELKGSLSKAVGGRHDIYFFFLRAKEPYQDLIKVKAVTFQK